jgi:pyrroline-5-carboxylate reductase
MNKLHEIKDKTIGFIGGGMMAEAIISGLLKSEIKNIIVSDSSEARIEYFKDKYSICASFENTKTALESDILILAVKPDIVPIVLTDIRESVDSSKLIISIAAGIPTAMIEESLLTEIPVIRAMPNTPALISMGASGVAAGKFADADHLRIALEIFSTIGIAVDVDESKIDVITGLSGSGPAYVYLIIEAMADGAVRMGLPRPAAIRLAAQTVAGAASMVLETNEHPAVLKDKVTTPGGTTIEGVAVLEKGAVRDSFIEAVSAAVKRSKELYKK